MALLLTEAVVSAIVERIFNAGEQHLSLLGEASHELESLSPTFRSIQAVLEDAESRQVGDKHVRLWLSRLRHAAYDVEDLLEEGGISSLGDQGGNEGEIVSHPNFADRINEIKERLDRIDVERNRFGFSSSPVGGDHRMLVRSQRLTTSLMDRPEMVIGRKNDKETMISRLVGGSSSNEDQGKVQVVAISGFGGLGKTALARLLYHDTEVRNYFKKALYWVCVSEPFDVTRLTKEIIEEVKRKPPTLSALNALQDELLKSLRGKRYLLVLDDVWNDDADKWEMLRLSLTSGANGSRILVTTCSEKVANTMNANYIHKLEGLSEKDSWEVFRSRAFAGKREADYSEFGSIGKGIVNKCKGVPLSIKVIGSAMNTKKTVEDWKNVLESKIWSLPQATDKILPALLLTYRNLPAHLKRCFAYCSIFPKDCELEKDKLVRLWVAQGFIQSEGSREKEDIGDEYFDELVAWSMFQEVEEKNKGKIVCKMHDLLHDLAEFIAKDEIFTFISKSRGGKSEESSSSSRNVRHAFLSFIGSLNIPIASDRAKNLRTLWIDGTVDGGIKSVIDEARFLRALHFPSSTRLPESIGELKHLSYLDLCKLDTVELPESMSRLRNLRTLNLSNCGKLEKLPRGIGEMISLRYLDLSDNSKIVELPESVSELRNLHTLNLSNCGKLIKLPWGIGGMVSLRCLDLSDNSHIVELPESASDLHNLHTLNLSNCGKLEKLPRGIGGMVRLRHLHIERTNSLKYMPKGLGRISGLRSLSKFIVGGEGGCGIDELQPFNSVQGSLEVEHLERVSNQEEAEKAQLWNKPHLRRLVLRMSVGGGGDAEPEWMDSVIEGLRPHGNLEELELDCHGISKLPSWMMASFLPNLTRLVISGFIHRGSLPGLGKLPALRYLHIEKAGAKKVGLEFYYGFNNGSSSSRNRSDVISAAAAAAATPFPKLEEFSLRSMSELEEWELPTTSTSEFADVIMMPCLHKLVLHDCPKLERLPHQLTKTPLKRLSIERCPRIKWIESFSSFPFLEKFKFNCNDSIEFFSTGSHPHLPNLKKIIIQKTRTVPDEGWEQLVALQKLEIQHCCELKRLPDGFTELPSLEHLRISYCNKLESLPVTLGQLKKLNSLAINGLSALKRLPDSLGQLASLERLEISELKKLESLPNSLEQLEKLKSLNLGGLDVLKCLPDSLGQLKSLERLEIRYCKNLESLPQSFEELKVLNHLEILCCEALGSLPHGLQNLPLLRELDIYECPRLSRRCKRKRGEDWPLISHIPKIIINGELIIR